MLNDRAQGIEFRTGQPDDDQWFFEQWMRNIPKPLPEPHLNPPAFEAPPPFEDPNQIFRAAADAEKIQSYLFTLRQQHSFRDPIFEYNASVYGPEARSKLEKENPALLAARGRSNSSTKKDRIQRELEAKQIQITRDARSLNLSRG
jgi:hypothetical protein